MFLLGLTDRDVEGQWVWASDGTPVTWTSWIEWKHKKHAPNGGSRENCAHMMRTNAIGLAGHRSEGWGDDNCDGNDYFGNVVKTSLICQRNSGMWRSGTIDLVTKLVRLPLKLNWTNQGLF